MAEYEYWYEFETGLTMLIEQLKIPIAKRMLGLLDQALSPIASSFQYFQAELWSHYVEARDNNKFLHTLTRHFKVIMKMLLFIFNIILLKDTFSYQFRNLRKFRYLLGIFLLRSFVKN